MSFAAQLNQDPTNKLTTEILQHAFNAGKILHGFTKYGKFSEEKTEAPQIKAIQEAHGEMIAMMAAYNKLRNQFGLADDRYYIIESNNTEQANQLATLDTINTMVSGLMQSTPSLGVNATNLFVSGVDQLNITKEALGYPDFFARVDKEIEQMGLIRQFFAEQDKARSQSGYILPVINEFMKGQSLQVAAG